MRLQHVDIYIRFRNIIIAYLCCELDVHCPVCEPDVYRETCYYVREQYKVFYLFRETKIFISHFKKCILFCEIYT